MFEDYEPKEVGRRAVAREICDWVEAAMLAVICVVLVFTFVVRLAGVHGPSMMPTLHHNDRLVITRLGGDFAQGDIVVLIRPELRYLDQPLVKRVIATEGQTIDIDFVAGRVFVDGREIYEPYIFQPTLTSWDVRFPQTVPQGHVFTMGDNRNNSLDSRDSRVGMVDTRRILGRAVYRVFPHRSIGRMNVNN